MSQQGSTYSLVGAEGYRAKWAESRTFRVALGLVIVLLVVTLVYFSLSANQPGEFAGSTAVTNTDTARWTAMGEHNRGPALNAERAVAVNAARWEALGEHYRGATYDPVHAMAASAARWEALGEHYRATVFDAGRVATIMSIRWNALGQQYAEADTFSARYQAMADWYTR